eukprot:scaffold502_cov115-Isochrysis_galbana.AAC.11
MAWPTSAPASVYLSTDLRPGPPLPAQPHLQEQLDHFGEAAGCSQHERRAARPRGAHRALHRNHVGVGAGPEERLGRLQPILLRRKHEKRPSHRRLVRVHVTTGRHPRLQALEPGGLRLRGFCRLADRLEQGEGGRRRPGLRLAAQ